jgi:hypothetical protein
MPLAIVLEIIEALAALAPQIPEVVSLVEAARTIVVAGTVTAGQEAAIRAQLDAVKAAIDAA